jgi:hypothetical protein
MRTGTQFVMDIVQRVDEPARKTQTTFVKKAILIAILLFVGLAGIALV